MSIKSKVVAAVAAAAIIGTGGAGLIKSSEGLEYVGYRDVVGVPTACYGHTGPDVVVGKRYSQAQCDKWLDEDIAKHQVVLYGPKSCIGDALKPGTNRMDAVTSFTFNVGTGAFCKSTMAKKLKAKDYAGASKEFPKWVYAGGKKYNGLVTRRYNEQSLFNSTTTWKPYYIKEVTKR